MQSGGDAVDEAADCDEIEKEDVAVAGTFDGSCVAFDPTDLLLLLLLLQRGQGHPRRTGCQSLRDQSPLIPSDVD